MLFAVKFQQWGLPSFPAGGLYSLKKGPSLTGLPRHLVLPCFVLLIVSVASYIRHLCASTLKVLHQDYVRTARAKGVADTSVVWKHTFKNAPVSRGWGPDSRDYIEKPLDLTGQRVEIVSGILHDECAALRAPAPN